MMHVYKFHLNIMIKTLHIRGSFLGAEEHVAVKYHSRKCKCLKGSTGHETRVLGSQYH